MSVKVSYFCTVSQLPTKSNPSTREGKLKWNETMVDICYSLCLRMIVMVQTILICDLDFKAQRTHVGIIICKIVFLY